MQSSFAVRDDHGVPASFFQENPATGGNHVADVGDVVEHPSHVFVMQVFFFHSEHGDAKYLAYVAVEENLKLVRQHFPHRPRFTPPQKEIHGDRPKE